MFSIDRVIVFTGYTVTQISAICIKFREISGFFLIVCHFNHFQNFRTYQSHVCVPFHSSTKEPHHLLEVLSLTKVGLYTHFICHPFSGFVSAISSHTRCSHFSVQFPLLRGGVLISLPYVVGWCFLKTDWH